MRITGIVEHDFHALGVGDEVRRQIAAVELHAFNDVERGVERLRFFDRDDAVLADLFHRLCDDAADGLVMVGRDGADLSDHRAAHRLGLRLERRHNGLNRLVDAAFDRHRVGAGGDVLRALTIEGLCQHRRGRGAVSRDVRGLACDFPDHLRAHILERIPQFDFFGDRHSVFGDRRRPVRFADE